MDKELKNKIQTHIGLRTQVILSVRHLLSHEQIMADVAATALKWSSFLHSTVDCLERLVS